MKPPDIMSAPWMVELRSSKAFVTWVVAIAVFTVRSALGVFLP